MQQNIYTAVMALPTAPGSVASPSPATFATTPAIAAPNAVPIERTEAKAEAVLRCSTEATLSIARATTCTLYTPMPIPITKALSVISASPGSKATAVRQASPVVAMTGPDASAKRSRFPDHPETVKVPMVQPIEMTMLRKLITTGDT